MNDSVQDNSAAITDVEDILTSVLIGARNQDFAGYSKHDALNAPWLDALAGNYRLSRLLAIQLVMRCPLHVRPWIGVREARNAKGIALFAMAYLANFRRTGQEEYAAQARDLLHWLSTHSADSEIPCWGYPYPWQDVGFFAPRNFPNRVVSTFVVNAYLDAYETLGDEQYLMTAVEAVDFLLNAPKILHDDANHLCLSYVPSEKIDWIVMDVSVLVGAVAARVANLTDNNNLMNEASRLVRYVVSKQTDYHAWFYTEPPGDSHITHDNYHTGFILDAIQAFGIASGSTEFATAYEDGLAYYRDALFEESGAPRFMNDQQFPYDIHGAAQGIITFSLAERHHGSGAETARKILEWTIGHMYDRRTNWFYYQKRRGFRSKIKLLRWCQAWMARAMSVHLENCKG